MTKDFIYRQTLVWLEMEQDALHLYSMSRGQLAIPRREQLAESLTNHLVNNWEMVERARKRNCRACQDGHQGNSPHTHEA